MKKSLYALYLICFCIVFTVLLWLGHSPVSFFLDIASFMLVIIFPILLLAFQNKLGLLKKYTRAVFSQDIDSDTALEGSRFFTTLSVYTLSTGLFGFLTGTIMMMGNLGDTSQVGPNMAMALISLLYAAMFCMLVYIPFKLALDSKKS